jgi:predicted GNAT family acetyltransferase
MSDSDDVSVIHDEAARRFVVGSGDEVALLQYRESPGRITFLHTEVPEAFRGRGIAQRLAHAGLEHARARGLEVIPLCPFVRAYLEKHREYASLVAKPPA